ncbi:MAG: isocitrate lyase/phosphoenolpyruvate mutase family protein [Opitutaceae bacterium]|jgi:2-methylisocitrate lyase-like PEP mutase family enzyme|nr:isocitrate lyase/phosphoenolpyruvate mutase family protein [Opitutaceae bacterium]
MGSSTVAEKRVQFRELHAADDVFVMPNPWDAASGRLLVDLGFPALATSSAAVAGEHGVQDYEITREMSLTAARELAEAVEVPVSADLENGFGDDPATVAETVRLAGEMGLAGCSIEDAKGGETLHEFTLAVERIVAAVEANRALEVPLVLTARVEHYAQPEGDLDDTIDRLLAFEAAGADVLFAPGVPDVESLRLICDAVAKPVSMIGSMAGGPHPPGIVDGQFARASFFGKLNQSPSHAVEHQHPSRIGDKYIAGVGMDDDLASDGMTSDFLRAPNSEGRRSRVSGIRSGGGEVGSDEKRSERGG